jgi:hypothetical protein
MKTNCNVLTDNEPQVMGPVVLTAAQRELPAWTQRLQEGLGKSIRASSENLGHLEEEILRGSRELSRGMLEEAAQVKADRTPLRCTKCAAVLRRCSQGHARTFESRFGPITIGRTRGWCRNCKKWIYPADGLLGLEETAGYSPGVQEMAALAVSKLPVAEASAVIERLTGVKLPRATLDREARRQGLRAQAQRDQLDEQMQTPQADLQKVHNVQTERPLTPFTLVIQLDAWNIRERDDWGKSEAQRAAGQEPGRWHWVYGGTCFRLSQRGKTAAGRPVILSRGYVMTRGGIDALRAQIWAEASRHGLGTAQDVLIVADGAVWIWKLAEDRFPHARQRLDAYHAKQHLWVVADALHGAGSPAARAWVTPLLAKLDQGKPLEIISDLSAILTSLEPARQQLVQREINYLDNNRHRMYYAEGKARGEPIGSGAMESTCRQYQCRFKRPSQLWSQSGDEAILCVETFWRNGRWNTLFPHVGNFDPSRN